MLTKIYWNNKTIFLCVSENAFNRVESKNPDKTWFPTTAAEVAAAIAQISIASESCFVLVHNDVDFLITHSAACFHVIEAAGGIVVNQKNKMLFIFRRGKWDLPKGKMELQETPEFCAEREIEEETGVNQLSLHHKLMDTYHIYEERGLQILKISHWFYFSSSFEGIVHPQLEEDITEIKWFSFDEYHHVAKSNSFDAIQDVVDCYSRSTNFE